MGRSKSWKGCCSGYSKPMNLCHVGDVHLLYWPSLQRKMNHGEKSGRLSDSEAISYDLRHCLGCGTPKTEKTSVVVGFGGQVVIEFQGQKPQTRPSRPGAFLAISPYVLHCTHGSMIYLISTQQVAFSVKYDKRNINEYPRAFLERDRGLRLALCIRHGDIMMRTGENRTIKDPPCSQPGRRAPLSTSGISFAFPARGIRN